MRLLDAIALSPETGVSKLFSMEGHIADISKTRGQNQIRLEITLRSCYVARKIGDLQKKVAISLAVTKYVFSDQNDWIKVACQGSSAMYICFAIIKRATRAVVWRPLPQKMVDLLIKKLPPLNVG